MQEIKRYQSRRVPGLVHRVSIADRTVDFWVPDGGSDHVLVAHDGQNIFDRRTATAFQTWKLAQTSIRIAQEVRKQPPLIIGVFHSSNRADPHGRAKDLCPEEPFRNGMKPATNPLFRLDELRSDEYLETIFNVIIPRIVGVTECVSRPETTAMIGSSLGGLATLYSAIKFPHQFHTALALSPHWTLAGAPLVDWMIPKLPLNEHFRIWMSRGTKGLDKEYESLQKSADILMSEMGWESPKFRSRVFDGYAHNERSWARSVSEPLRFWLQGT